MLYRKPDDKPKIIDSATISGASVTNPDELQCHIRRVALDRIPGPDHFIMKQIVARKDSLLLPYVYKGRRISPEEKCKTVGDVSMYDFNMQNHQASKDIGKKKTDGSV